MLITNVEQIKDDLSQKYDIIDSIDMTKSLSDIKSFLLENKKESFEPSERLVFFQTLVDQYDYVDAPGKKIIELQNLLNEVDISSCFILIVTTNPEIKLEIDDITKNYSVDKFNAIDFYIINGSYDKQVTQINNATCKKMWDHLYVGTDGNINPCCLADHRFPLGNIEKSDTNEIINSESAKNIRKQMLDGYRPKACKTCWVREDNNLTSDRIPFNIKEKQKLNETIEHFQPTSLDIRLNNICNFKCRMCSEYFSSSIRKETIDLYGKNARLGHEKILLNCEKKSERTKKLKKILPYVNTSVKKIYFAGGEPLITDEHYAILDKLLSHKHTSLKLTYNTNLSKLIYKNNNVIDYWKMFKDVQVGASIDASDDIAEYVRHGTIWSEILENIKNIKRDCPHVDLRITSVAGILNTENLIRLQKRWIQESRFNEQDFSVNVLIDPTFLSLSALPRHHKKRISESILNHINTLCEKRLKDEWHEVLHYMNNNDHTHALTEFKKRNQVLDVHRNESFAKVFPELIDLYD